ncbi:hypothetical protein BC828DRAFT_378989 [Blastocladiella britannica]|nr:hypothetical protein BC828DRAFT_378989 [Blastocladiella britannica]
MHAVVDYILQPRRFRSIAHLSLDDVVREWHVLPVFRESTKTWTFPAPEPLTACLAAPRLRPVPEGLQLPGQYLLMGELDLFMATTRRLALLVPTLTSATAPIALWLRLGIDDRDAVRRGFSTMNNPSNVMEPARMTLPTYWAVLAAAEGRASILDFLVAELNVDAHALMAFLSRKLLTSYFLKSLIQFSAATRVMPTWHWLIAHGYHFSAGEFGLLVIYAQHATEYETVRSLFHAFDKPNILADPVPSKRSNWRLMSFLEHWARRGHVGLISELAELGALSPWLILQMLEWNVPGATILPVIMSIIPLVPGGMDAVISAGLEPHKSNKDVVIKLAFLLGAQAMTNVVVQHGQRLDILEAILGVQGIQSRVDHVVLLHYLLEPYVKDGQRIGPELANESQIKLLMRVLCDPGQLGVSAWNALDALSVPQRLQLFTVIAAVAPRLTYVSESEDPAPVASVGSSYSEWPTWQWVLDQLLARTQFDPHTDPTDHDLVLPLLHQFFLAAWDPPTRGAAAGFVRDEVTGSRWDAYPTAAAAAAAPVPIVGTRSPLVFRDDLGTMAPRLAVWAAARLCVLALDATRTAGMRLTADTPTWLWQARLDAITAASREQPLTGKWAAIPLDSTWPEMVDAAIAAGRTGLAQLILQVVAEEQRTMQVPLLLTSEAVALK